ncbi:MAG: NAD(P)-binding domain-containing protein [Caulobacter sp.]
MSDVSVIGLGQMGQVLARLFLRSGRTVTVWNRTAEKAAGLVSEGAVLAASAAEAIQASPVTVLILYDDDAVEAVIAEGLRGPLDGRILINLGTSGPDATRGFQTKVTQQGGLYVDGAIQAAPSQMGEPHTPVFVSGDAKVLERVQPLLQVLAGNVVRVGSRIDASAFMDLATLSYVYGAFAGFLHGARIAEAVGIDVATYGKLVHDIAPSFGAFFEHEAQAIASGDFRATESPMRISVSAVERIVVTSRQLGLDDAVPSLMHDWLGAAVEAGYQDEELAALIKVIRDRASSPHR